MSLSATLRATFLEFAKARDLKPCMLINAMYKKPRYYYNVYHDAAENRLVVEGFSVMPQEAPVETFLLLNKASEITVADLLLHHFPLAADSTDIVRDGCQATEDMLNQKVITVNETLWICN